MIKKQILAVMMTACMMMTSILSAYAEETDPYPLKGIFPYTEITRESIDKKLAEGWVFIGDPYVDVGTCLPFTNNVEWAQVNAFYGQEISYDKILITLAGLKPTPDPITGSELTEYERKLSEEVVKYLNSYDWKQASDYEKAAYTAEFIASRCVYVKSEGGGVETNSGYSCLINGKSMCDGFAQAYHLLTRASGLKTVYISRNFHAINFVNIDGIWREIDVSYLPGFADKRQVIDILLNDESKIIDKYLWERSTELEFDPTLPSTPLY